jgi:hypothetical protein
MEKSNFDQMITLSWPIAHITESFPAKERESYFG